jgi:arginine-tRNA-protein transferase
MNDINKSNEYEFLIKNGFRRSHNILYNQVCSNCNLCRSIRINVKKFTLSKSNKRILNKNKNLFLKKLSESPTEEQFLLFKKYLKFKHYDSEMNEMNFDDYCKMFNAPGIITKIYEYYYQDELVGCVISDFLEGALSMVYSFYSDSFLKNSFGKYVIIDHFRLAQEVNKKYVYLGYWVEGSSKMDYKNSFNSSEVLIDNIWTSI